MVVSISMGGTRDPLGLPWPPRVHATEGQSARHPTNVRLGVDDAGKPTCDFLKKQPKKKVIFSGIISWYKSYSYIIYSYSIFLKQKQFHYLYLFDKI